MENTQNLKNTNSNDIVNKEKEKIDKKIEKLQRKKVQMSQNTILYKKIARLRVLCIALAILLVSGVYITAKCYDTYVNGILESYDDEMNEARKQYRKYEKQLEDAYEAIRESDYYQYNYSYKNGRDF